MLVYSKLPRISAYRLVFSDEFTQNGRLFSAACAGTFLHFSDHYLIWEAAISLWVFNLTRTP